ncbi:hypothetical protein D9758_017489 [Tetrapyrgos nigripes]|uniref:Dirigent protein n=1 Tax=Tetrapyrgos nigripes TaxID=182062 RepID=A0A8H5C3M1_9AGAR|nr:hypothetical protein D9758_017489 [Tetrapyrgos nigripes]
MNFKLFSALAFGFAVANVISTSSTGPGGADNVVNTDTNTNNTTNARPAPAAGPFSVAIPETNPNPVPDASNTLASDLLLGCSVAALDAGTDPAQYVQDFATFMFGNDPTHNFLIATGGSFGASDFGVEGVDWEQADCSFQGVIYGVYALRNGVYSHGVDNSGFWEFIGVWTLMGDTVTFISPV